MLLDKFAQSHAFVQLLRQAVKAAQVKASQGLTRPPVSV
jgi:hypothetical protein